MIFKRLKTYMPRGLYGRAALILLLPVITLQIAVTISFVQKHFAGMTASLTVSFAETAIYAMAHNDAAGHLGLAIEEVQAAPEGDDWDFYDLTGVQVIANLRAKVPDVRSVDLSEDGRVILYAGGAGKLWKISAERARVSASNPHQLIVLLVLTGLLMSVIAFIFLRNQLRPIARLAEAATEYGKGRVKPYTPAGAQEVRVAGTAFLEMRSRIERMNQSRNLMFSGISHDLRTPLTRLKLSLSFFDDDQASGMRKDVEEMEHLIDAFLDYGRADAGAILTPTDPEGLLADILRDAQRAGQAVSLGRVDLPDPKRPVPMRPRSIRRAIENLTQNALRYGGTRVEISVVRTERTLRFEIEDDGPGIRPEAREEAMKPFSRLDPARNQNAGTGVGLGLAIVSDIARLHGGVLRLSDSERLGGLKAEIVIAL